MDGNISTSTPPIHSSTPQPQDPFTAQRPSTNGSAAVAPSQAHQLPGGPDGLAQSKEKARALMASSAAHHTPTPPQRNPSRPPTAANNPSQLGTPVSRKRSRSGSRIDGSNNKPSAEYTKLVIDQYIAHDQAHAAARARDQERVKALRDELLEERKAWDEYHRRRLHAARPGGRRETLPVYEAHKAPIAKRRTEYLTITRRTCQKQAEQLETLAPVRLDIEFEKLRLRDTFTWNIADEVVPTGTFIRGLIEDFKIPKEAYKHFENEAHRALKEQLQDFHPHPFLSEDALDPQLPYSAYKNDEIRVLIKLNITIGQHQLTDQFDWDINNPHNSPEEFARQMAKDMSLSGDFTTAIAASIHEQIQPYTKALYMSGHEFDGRVPESTDIRDQMLPSPLSSAFRTFTSAKDCTPAFFELDDKNQYAQELSYDREQRQQKRSGNRGIDPRSGRGAGLTLPDLKERPQVNRTRIVSSIIPGAAENVDKSGIYRMAHKKKRPWNAGRGMGGAAAEESDTDLEASSSDGESPIRGAGHLLGGGTSRTRGMRGAAAAAQSAMRKNYNERSPSPADAPPTYPPQNRTTSLRFKANPIWEDYDSGDERVGLTVKIKMPRERFRQWWREWKRSLPQREIAQQQQQQEAAMRARRQQMEMLQRASATPAPGQPMGPPSTPGMGGGRGLPGMGGTPRPGSGMGGMTPTPSGVQGHPEPPAWLREAVNRLRAEHPDDRFEGMMRLNREVPEGHPNHWQPRIRCFDCQGTLYNADPSDPMLSNFKNHLNFSKHKRTKEERILREQGRV